MTVDRSPITDFRLPITDQRSAIAPAGRTLLRPADTPYRGFSLLELILVLVLIVLAAAIVWPAIHSAFADYHVERAADALRARVAHTRLQAMEQGIPYAFSYLPDGDQFWTWACEPLDTLDTGVGSSSAFDDSGRASGITDTYDRRHFSINHKADNQEFRFLAASADELIQSMGLGADARAELPGAVSAESVAASSMLAPNKLGLSAGSLRSLVALQVPGLQLTGAAEPIVFEADGTADQDAIIRIAGRNNRFVEITVHATTGAITMSPARLVADLPGAVTEPDRSGAAGRSSGMPSRSRELRSVPGGSR